MFQQGSDRNYFVGLGNERGEQTPLGRPADVDRFTSDEATDGAQHPDLHHDGTLRLSRGPQAICKALSVASKR
jgi:hypothetical protein